MSDQTTGSIDRRWLNEGVISAISVGMFFVLIGVVFVINPNLVSRSDSFFRDITSVQVGNVGGSRFFLPAPATPADHIYVYTTASQFALGVGILEVVILALRISLGSRIRRTAQTVGDLVFWFGAADLLNSLASMKSGLSISQQRETWFVFWAAIIMLIGFALIVRGLVLLSAKRERSKTVIS